MIKKIGKILLGISLFSVINIDKVNAEENQLLSELILGKNNSNVIATAPTFSSTSTDIGLYVQEGDSAKSMQGAPTYYYRGAVKNNYVSFADQLWRIVRINEDGSIKLITENKISNDSTKFSSSMSDNYNDSEIKVKVDTWYNSKIGNNELLNSKVVTSSFCNDISDDSNAASNRIENQNPIFTCPSGALVVNSKVGMLTVDEVMYAGALSDQKVNGNESYILNLSSWTMTPVSNIIYFTWLSGDKVINKNIGIKDFAVAPIRAVINLDSKVLASGTGIESDPYIISEKLYGETNQEEEKNETYLNIKLDSNSKKDKIEDVVKNNTKLYFEVEENNIFPGKVKINVSEKYSDGSKLWLYKYNKDTNKIEYVKNNIEVKNGIVTINIDKAEEYFLALNEIDSSILGEQLGINLVFVIVFLGTILIGGTYALIYTYKLQKNRI